MSLTAGPKKTVGDCPDEGAHVEHVVVETEIVRRNQVNAAGFLAQPVFPANALRGRQQLRFRDPARPVTFQRPFQLTAWADAWKTEIVGSNFHINRYSVKVSSVSFPDRSMFFTQIPSQQRIKLCR